MPAALEDLFEWHKSRLLELLKPLTELCSFPYVKKEERGSNDVIHIVYVYSWRTKIITLYFDQSDNKRERKRGRRPCITYWYSGPPVQITRNYGEFFVARS